VNFERRIRTGLVTLAVLVATAGTALAVLFFVPAGIPTFPLAPPPPPAMGALVVINTNPVAAGGYGDQIVTVEEGHDINSPFCQIGVLMGAANPAYGAAVGWAGNIQMYATGAPGWFYPVPQAPQNPAPGQPVFVTFMYRPTNHPLNPGYAPPPPIGAGLLEIQNSQVHQMAQAFAALRSAVPPANAPAATWAEFAIDANPQAPSFLEFWQYRIVY